MAVQTQPNFSSPTSSSLLACVASVSVRSMSKERGTRVENRAKNGASKKAHFLALVSFFARSKPKIPLLGLLCSYIKRKRLLRRLLASHPETFFKGLSHATPHQTGSQTFASNPFISRGKKAPLCIPHFPSPKNQRLSQ